MLRKKNIQTARMLDTTKRPSVAPAAIKGKHGLPEKIFGLIGVNDSSSICDFIKDPANGEKERLNVITNLQNATLIPSTYELVQRTLLRLSKNDPSPAIKAACDDTFTAQRERLILKFKKVV